MSKIHPDYYGFIGRCAQINDEVLKENAKQFNKWGLQDLKEHVENLLFRMDLLNEICDSGVYDSPEYKQKLRQELIQVASVAVAFIDKIDRIDLTNND